MERDPLRALLHPRSHGSTIESTEGPSADGRKSSRHLQNCSAFNPGDLCSSQRLVVTTGHADPIRSAASFVLLEQERAQKKYYVPVSGYEYPYSHPPPESLVILVANKRDRQGPLSTACKQKDAKKLDLLGRKVYLTDGLQLCISNQQALLRRYDYNLWDSVQI